MGLVPGKIALVTGSGAGIGRASAIRFAEEGAKVAVSDVNIDAGNETVALIKRIGGDAIFIKADVARAAEVKALIAGIVDTYGRLDCACNNAGIEGKIVPIVGQSEDNFDQVMSVNAKGVFLCLKYEIAQMLKNGGGAIANLASVAGLVGFPGLGPYVASKHAINGLTKNAALEYSKQGIRVNSVCPGGIETRMLDSLVAQASAGRVATREMMDPLHPIGRIGRPGEVAEEHGVGELGADWDILLGEDEIRDLGESAARREIGADYFDVALFEDVADVTLKMLLHALPL